mmetsp:Transcript_3603/g.8651  ORF Transcript_3603/g.8651 Transcript_3603/m.8651 type:complete len:250 (-) Transcript_3603:1750-2499(-)
MMKVVEFCCCQNLMSMETFLLSTKMMIWGSCYDHCRAVWTAKELRTISLYLYFLVLSTLLIRCASPPRSNETLQEQQIDVYEGMFRLRNNPTWPPSVTRHSPAGREGSGHDEDDLAAVAYFSSSSPNMMAYQTISMGWKLAYRDFPQPESQLGGFHLGTTTLIVLRYRYLFEGVHAHVFCCLLLNVHHQLLYPLHFHCTTTQQEQTGLCNYRLQIIYDVSTMALMMPGCVPVVAIQSDEVVGHHRVLHS